jgi:probable HAF family extracellular repeat protein
LAAHETTAFGINTSGQIVGNYHDNSGYHGFLLSDGVYTTLDDPLATQYTYAFGINNAGQVVGSYDDSTGYDDTGHSHSFLLTITPNPPPSGATTADMILRDGSDGRYEIYDIGSNAILAADFLGQVATNWAFVTQPAWTRSPTGLLATGQTLRARGPAPMKPSAFRIERLLAKVEAEVVPPPRARRYVFHPDEVAEAEAQGLPPDSST